MSDFFVGVRISRIEAVCHPDISGTFKILMMSGSTVTFDRPDLATYKQFMERVDEYFSANESEEQ